MGNFERRSRLYITIRHATFPRGYTGAARDEVPGKGSQLPAAVWELLVFWPTSANPLTTAPHPAASGQFLSLAARAKSLEISRAARSVGCMAASGVNRPLGPHADTAPIGRPSGPSTGAATQTSPSTDSWRP